MSTRASRHVAREANTRGGNGGERDYPAMFEAMAEAIMQRVPAPVAATVDVGVRVPRVVDFAKLCKDFTSLGGNHSRELNQLKRFRGGWILVFESLET